MISDVNKWKGSANKNVNRKVNVNVSENGNVTANGNLIMDVNVNS